MLGQGQMQPGICRMDLLQIRVFVLDNQEYGLSIGLLAQKPPTLRNARKHEWSPIMCFGHKPRMPFDIINDSCASSAVMRSVLAFGTIIASTCRCMSNDQDHMCMNVCDNTIAMFSVVVLSRLLVIR